MKKTGIVAIVGRPNVGKSTFFNRIIGERVSIVEDTPGVTRDRIYAKANWLGSNFTLIDTGGIELSDQPFLEEIKAQVEIAITEADVIIQLCNGQDGVTKDDLYVSRLLKKTKKPVILAVNKIDDVVFKANIYDFYQLGIGEPIACSSSHGIGVGDVLDLVCDNLPIVSEKTEDDVVRFSIIGRPNVGKSSLTNALLNQERVIVSDLEGTTRDAIDTPFVREGQKYVVIDTAGIRKKGKVYESVEKYSVLRAHLAIEKSDVVLVMIDASVGIREQDKHVAGYAHEANKAIIIVVNKWDLVEKNERTMNEFIADIRAQFKYLAYANIVFLSAITKKKIHNLFPAILSSYENSKKRISTSILNEVIMDAQMLTPPAGFNQGTIRIYYASQVAIQPPTFVLFVNNPRFMHFSYMRYLENRLREAVDFEGTPIRFILRERK